MDILQTSPGDARQIKTWTNDDPLLTHVKEMVLKAWSNTSEENLKPYQHHQNVLSVHAGCVLLSNRVIIPSAGRQKALELATTPGHSGIKKIKRLARSFAW